MLKYTDNAQYLEVVKLKHYQFYRSEILNSSRSKKLPCFINFGFFIKFKSISLYIAFTLHYFRAHSMLEI